MLFSEQVSSPSRQSADLLENKMRTAEQHEFKAGPFRSLQSKNYQSKMRSTG